MSIKNTTTKIERIFNSIVKDDITINAELKEKYIIPDPTPAKTQAPTEFNYIEPIQFSDGFGSERAYNRCRAKEQALEDMEEILHA